MRQPEGRYVPESVEDTQELLDRLQWARNAKRALQDLPAGMLKEEIEFRVQRLLEAPDLCKVSVLEARILDLDSQLRACKCKIVELEDSLSAPYPEESDRCSRSLSPSRGMLFRVVLVIIFLLFVWSVYGAYLDLGGARRAPDALSFPTPIRERNTQDAEVSAAPGKLRVPPVDYRRSPTTH